MNTNLTLSLQITLIGMSLVFGAILLLWGVLALIVRLTGTRPETTKPANTAAEHLLKRRAAAAAVALALTRQAAAEEPREFPLPPTALVSAWQAVMRSNILNKRGNVR